MTADQWWALAGAATPLAAWLLLVAWDWAVGVLVLDAPDALDVDPVGGAR